MSDQERTVTTWLYARLNIPDTLNCDSVLIISVDKLILQLSNFEDQDTQFISDIRDIFVALFTPD